jgi:hypothetical protein
MFFRLATANTTKIISKERVLNCFRHFPGTKQSPRPPRLQSRNATRPNTADCLAWATRPRRVGRPQGNPYPRGWLAIPDTVSLPNRRVVSTLLYSHFRAKGGVRRLELLNKHPALRPSGAASHPVDWTLDRSNPCVPSARCQAAKFDNLVLFESDPWMRVRKRVAKREAADQDASTAQASKR